MSETGTLQRSRENPPPVLTLTAFFFVSFFHSLELTRRHSSLSWKTMWRNVVVTVPNSGAEQTEAAAQSSDELFGRVTTPKTTTFLLERVVALMSCSFLGGERRWAVCNRISLQSHSTNINVSSRWYSHFWGSVGGKTVQFASVKERRRKFETPPANPTLQTLQTRRDLSHVYDAFSFFLQTRRARQQQQTGGPVFRNRPCELFPFFSAALHPFRRYEKCRVFQSMNFIVRSHPVHSGFSNQKYNWKRN